jgi:hypothetical protein
MQRVHVLAVSVLAGLASGAVLAVSAGGQEPPPPAAAAPADFTVTTTMRERDTTFVDNPPRRRQNAGDVVAGTGRITGERTGTFDFACTAASRQAFLCMGSSSFPDGAIHLQARLRGEPDTIAVAIVGGTGAFAGARGTLTSTTTSERGGVTVSRDVYDFVG